MLKKEIIQELSHKIRQPLMHTNAVIMNIQELIKKHDCNALEKKVEELIEINEEISKLIENLKKEI